MKFWCQRHGYILIFNNTHKTLYFIGLEISVLCVFVNITVLNIVINIFKIFQIEKDEIRVVLNTVRASWLQRASTILNPLLLPTDAHNVKKRRVIKTF